MTTHCTRTTVQLLNSRHWVTTTEAGLLAHLVATGIARKTYQGYELINPSTCRGLLRNHYSQRNTRTETGAQITRHTSAIRFTNAGIAWLAEQLVEHAAA